MQESKGTPSISTLHAPHSPTPHPFLAPVYPKRFLKSPNNDSRISTSKLKALPFTEKAILLNKFFTSCVDNRCFQGSLHEFFHKMFSIFFRRPPRRCLLYTSPSPRDGLLSRMPSSA